MKKSDNLFSLEIVMVGSQEECEDYTAEISFMDPKSKPVLSFSFPPRPISMEDWGDTCLTVTEKSLASIWRYSHEEKASYIEVAVNIYSNEGGQGWAKKARVEESKEDSDTMVSLSEDGEEKSDKNNDIEEESNDTKSDEKERNDNINMSNDKASALGNKEDVIADDDIEEDDVDEDDIDEDDIDEDDLEEDDIDEEEEMV